MSHYSKRYHNINKCVLDFEEYIWFCNKESNIVYFLRCSSYVLIWSILPFVVHTLIWSRNQFILGTVNKSFSLVDFDWSRKIATKWEERGGGDFIFFCWWVAAMGKKEPTHIIHKLMLFAWFLKGLVRGKTCGKEHCLSVLRIFFGNE